MFTIKPKKLDNYNSKRKSSWLCLYHGVGATVIKNCEPLVFGPELAIDNKNGTSCLKRKFSSGNFSP